MDAVRVQRRVTDAEGKGVDRTVGDLLDRYETVIYQFSFLILRDPDLAAECTQETFVRAYEHLLRGRTITAGWLYTVARSRAIDEIRRQRRVRHRDEDPAASTPGIGSTLEVREAFGQLSEDDRAILYLRAEGLSTEEIAHVLGIRVGASRKRITRALGRLRKLLGDDGE